MCCWHWFYSNLTNSIGHNTTLYEFGFTGFNQTDFSPKYMWSDHIKKLMFIYNFMSNGFSNFTINKYRKSINIIQIIIT